MEVGYLPDMFGHVAQMPQILDQAGFGHAVVWRGVPSAVDQHRLRLDRPRRIERPGRVPGGRVRQRRRPPRGRQAAGPSAGGHGGGVRLVPARGRPDAAHERLGPPAPPAVARPGGGRGQRSSRTTSTCRSPRCRTTWPAPAADGLVEWHGELRSGFRSNVLMGVASNRVDVKQAAARAERSLERLAEPLSALFVPAERWPGAFLDVAWTLMVRNSAHDSICACSADEVVDAVLHRYAEARHIGEGLTEQALQAVGRSMAAAGPGGRQPDGPRSGRPGRGGRARRRRARPRRPGAVRAQRAPGLDDPRRRDRPQHARAPPGRPHRRPGLRDRRRA